MSEQCYYKVENKDSGLFKKASEFLTMEEELRKKQREAIVARVPKFKTYQGEKGFNRIVRFKGFVFDDPESIDPKVWSTKMVDGYMLSVPYLRTKAGREMDKFLKSFKRTNAWDVDRLLGIKNKEICGSFYPANLFEYNDCIYISLDTQFRDVFESNNTDLVEITYGEMNKAIDGYNELVEKSRTNNVEV